MASSKEIAKPASHKVDKDLLINATTIEELEAILGGIEDYAFGVRVVDKSMLVDRDIILCDWTFNVSKTVTQGGIPVRFVSVTVFDVETRTMAVFNDGSTGVFAQLEAYTEKHDKVGAIRLRQGLRVSEYDYVNEKGDTTPAKTYYLA
jgi:hypothetical protein